MNIHAQSWLVMGLGASGQAAARLLLREGARVFLWDGCVGAKAMSLRATCSSLIDLGAVWLDSAGPDPAQTWDGAILSPGIPLDSPMVSSVRDRIGRLWGEIELAFRYWDRGVVAITGTNGKSTTTELTARGLAESGIASVACGNIGRPFCDVVLNEPNVQVAVVEVSSFQLESIEDFRPHVAVYLNLAPDHLDRYPDMTHYGQAKERIYENQGECDTLIVRSGLLKGVPKSHTITFGSEPADVVFDGQWIHKDGANWIDLRGTVLTAPHNAENAMAAALACSAMGANDAAIEQSFKSYRLLPHRCEEVTTFEGVRFVNDSKATNPDAVARALEGMESPVALIAGGRNKGFDFAPLAEQVGRVCRRVVLIGEAADHLCQVWGHTVDCEKANDMSSAVKKAFGSGDVKTVLLSPGCASFDMFMNFEDRGDCFKQAVLSMTNR